jgi:hypothetical protein
MKLVGIEAGSFTMEQEDKWLIIYQNISGT